jgi:alpha-L-fucosidase 2
LDAYVQRESRGRPSVLVIHGGGWSTGSRIAHVGQILEVLTRAGYNWFSLDYRLGGLAKFEDSVADVRAAVAFIRCHAQELRVDADKLVLLGEDAGAQLAAVLAGEQPRGVVGAILIGGFYDLAELPELSKDVDPDVLARASPQTRAAMPAVPLLVILGRAVSE